MEAEQTQSFNQKLSQWIASQGFWFQLRHSLSGGGGWAMTMSHLFRLGLKVLIVLVLAAGGFGFWLFSHIGSKSFVENLEAGFRQGANASEVRIIEFSRIQGDAQVRRIGAEGGKDSFFHTLDAGNVRFKMGILDGFTGNWNAGTIVAKSMDINVKAGGESPREAKESAQALFRDRQGFRFSSVEVDEATVRWGYSDRTRGKIVKSRMKATPSGDAWHLEFSGGTFSQNWLKGMEIESLIMDCTPSGLKITKGEFKAGGGTVKFMDVQAAGGDKPVLSGKIELTKVPLANLLPDSALTYVEGVISGEFKLSGSTNSVEGVQLEGDIVLNDSNTISLRDQFQLLRKLGELDLYHSYRKVDLNHGSMHIKTSGGAMSLSRVDVRAEDVVKAKKAKGPDDKPGEDKTELLITLQGKVTAVIPEETAQTTASVTPGSAVFDVNPKNQDPKDKLTLEGAGGASKDQGKDAPIFGRFADANTQRVLEDEKLKLNSQAIKYEGGFRMSIPGDAFDASQSLSQHYEVDSQVNRIAFDVPVQGTIHDVTARQAKELQELSEKH
ncbi:hypothetical protein [Haloferula sp. BvORR071]|uniref:hypothetical protein n=1 Tax=Haloferula sp. BvORR071 TaxID=1396141 RepID=UPI00054D777F|nr:hypothetical protein [Haloferula sp. BvORR071]